MKKQLRVTFLSALTLVPFTSGGQGLTNGSFELYNRDNHFLVGWHARSGAGKDYGAVVGGISGSVLDHVTSTPQGLFVAIGGPLPTLEGFPIGNYWLYARGPATTIEQRFIVPENTGSLQYRAFNGYYGSGVSVQINGTTLEPQRKAVVRPGSLDSPPIEDWWVDMRPYAGQEVDLTFFIGQPNAGIDDVRVSAEVVPEPGVIALGILGAATLMAARLSQSTSFRGLRA